jgi:hypothetical protein
LRSFEPEITETRMVWPSSRRGGKWIPTLKAFWKIESTLRVSIARETLADRS